MDKDTARAILPLVNDLERYDLLQSYVRARIEVLRGYLESTKELNKVLEIQGSIAELRRFQTLREQAVEGSK
jgi:glutaredoxin-related protein